MAFEQYTRCIEPSRYVPRSFALMVIQAGFLTAPFYVAGSGHPWCLLIVAEIYVLALLILYCRNWLYERLICLGGDRAAIGAVISVSPPPGALALDWDNDYSIDLLLPNTEFGVGQAAAQATPPLGVLIAPQDVITNAPVNRSTPGHGTIDKHGTKLKTFGLHAEFEGAGNYNLLQVAETAMGFAVILFIACLFAPPWLSIAFAIFLGLLGLIGATVTKFLNPGSPSDVNPNLATIHVNDEDNDGHGKGADVLFVQGTWVFDPLHDGWNEFHPIKTCTKIGCWKGDWTDFKCGDPGGPTPPTILLRLQQAFGVAQAEETRANQARPEHQWRLHPELDGCAPDIIL